jgi:hypothetical protein
MMDGDGNHWLLFLEFFGFAGLTVALACQQLWALKKLSIKRMEKERAEDAAATIQPG